MFCHLYDIHKNPPLLECHLDHVIGEMYELVLKPAMKSGPLLRVQGRVTAFTLW